ncbi:hypothetical protein SUGI_0571940 [Cryptomeria japonica]|uniref:putative UPF0481 protein At3g02645 n=1 Tax=Cryptomeria japonica TaxID=3369 RepID=UPI002408929B|nr:putative UPF0481 protein At3g02645 [Cryptomeria japonica]GLJ28978.1 hypothetical protein SUGI_0571940 [Cryptomeria japonica]
MGKSNGLISDEWIMEVEAVVNASKGDNEEGQEKTGMSRRLRLPRAMMESKADAYTPHMVSLGPYHRHTLKDVAVGDYHQRLTYLSQMDAYKLSFAREATANNPSIINSLVEKITEPDQIKALEEFYDWKVGEEDSKKFGWMMTLDAFFLSYILHSSWDTENGDTEEDSVVPGLASIRCDILKLENQIPLFLLNEVERTLQAKGIEDPLHSRIPRLCSFQIFDLHLDDLEKEEHLLGSVHKYVSSFLQIDTQQKTLKSTFCRITLGDAVAAICGIFFPHPAKRGRRDFLNKYNAEELSHAGITFKAFTEPGSVRFDKYSDTLYLPQIIISDTYTEVLLRNLLALEFVDARRRKDVSNYVELMDCLIDTDVDVALLRSSQVIVRQSMMITDEYVAKMWDGMCKPFFFSGFLEPPQGLKSQIKEVLIKNYYKSKIKSVYREFREQYLSRPWQVVALVVGIIVVVMDTLQTYCSFRDCQSSAVNDNSSSGRKHFNRFG